MSSLNSYHILSKKDNVITVEVNIIHPDEHFIHDTSNVALQIILELYEKIKLAYIYNSSGYQYFPFSQEKGNSLVLPENVPILDELLLKMRWREIPISQEEYETRQKNNDYTYNGQQTSGMGMSNGQYHIFLETEHHAFCEEADKHIELVEVLKTQNFPHWFDSMEIWLETGIANNYGFDDATYDKYQNSPHPAYTLRISVNPQSIFLLHHVEVGSHWESAGYNFLGYAPDYVEKKEPIYHCLYYDIDEKTIPQDEILTNWWAGLSENWKKAFWCNYFIQQNYFFSQIKHQYHDMVFLYALEDNLGKDFPNKLLQKEPTIQDLRLMSQLKIMYLSGFQLTDTEPLRLLKRLKILQSEANNFTNLEALGELTDLEDLLLIIYENPKPSHLFLKNLTKMRMLGFDASTQEELEVVLKMPNLRNLFLFTPFEVNPAMFLACESLKRLVVSDKNTPPIPNPDKQTAINALREKNIHVDWQIEIFDENDEFIGDFSY